MENVGTIGCGVAGGLLAPHLARRRPFPGAGRTSARGRWVVRLLALDLWGGAWCNNTPAAARWYGREGQGPAQHMAFAAAHVHPFALGRMDRSHLRLPWWAWATAHYAYLLLATAVIARAGRRRRGCGLSATIGGVVLGRILGAPPTAPWFAPVYYVKLLAGHAAGAAVLPVDPLAPGLVGAGDRAHVGLTSAP